MGVSWHTANLLATEKVCSQQGAAHFRSWQNAAMSKPPANRIAHWRKIRKISQEALGDQLNPPAHKGLISQYESGKRTPSLERLVEMARVLDVEASDLLETRLPAEVINIWDRIPIEDHATAMKALKVFASE
jgi:transcriptional regulator with XRE-family HTH domain